MFFLLRFGNTATLVASRVAAHVGAAVLLLAASTPGYAKASLTSLPLVTDKTQPGEYFDAIRVRTFKSQKMINLSGFGIRIQGQMPTVNESVLPIRAHYKITREHSGWLIVSVDIKNYAKAEAKYVSKIISGDKLKISGDLLKVEGADLSEDIILALQGDGSFDVIANYNLEEYLKGVLPSEMPIKWPVEALRAQAVAARTYAMSIMTERKNEAFHVDNTVQHQVFMMQNFSGATYEAQQKILDVIQTTKGIYLVNAKGAPYRTYFHADCGGSTEEPKNVWGDTHVNGTVKDERCQINPMAAWQTIISRDEVEDKLKKLMKIDSSSRMTALTIASNTGSGRVNELLVHFLKPDLRGDSNDDHAPAEPYFRAISGQDFRKAFGYNRVKSTQLEFNLTDQNLVLTGRGHGHGAGLCQKGARFMALGGAKFTEIINRYYPNATFIWGVSK